MILKDISGIDIELNGTECEICEGTRFDIFGSGEIDTFTRCGIWYIRTKGGRFRIILPSGNLILTRIRIRAEKSSLRACAFCALDTELMMSRSSCVFEKIDSRCVYAELGEGLAQLSVSGFRSASFNCGKGEMNIGFACLQKNCAVKTVRGIGSISIDGEKLPRNYSSESDGSSELYIKCGLGSVNAVFLI